MLSQILKNIKIFSVFNGFISAYFLIIFFLTGTSASYAAAFQWGDIIMDSQYEFMKSQNLNKVVFPHWIHRIRYKCKACHSPDLDMKDKKKSGINMEAIMQGNWCGECHNGKIAFSPLECKRCHSYSTDDEEKLDKTLKRNYPINDVAKRQTLVEADPDDKVASERIKRKHIFLDNISISSDESVFMNSQGKLGSIGKPGTYISKAYMLNESALPSALKRLPKDRFGLVDWVASVKEKKISPIAGIKEKKNGDRYEDYDVKIKPKSDFLDPLTYPHDIHSYFLECTTCHPAIFVSKAEKNPDMSMTGIAEGKWCGKCHGKVAFPLDDCSRCHSDDGSKYLQTGKSEAEVKKPESSLIVPIQRSQDGLIYIAGVCFERGDKTGVDANEIPVREVCINDFLISDHEVTQKEWKDATWKRSASYFQGDDLPVEQVNWQETQTFINSLNKKTGMTYRLLTEAEWEYAAMGGKYGTAQSVEDEAVFSEYSWFYLNSGGKTQPVKTKKPNTLGIYDMLGNVWEWCSDWYDQHYYEIAPKDNPKGPEDGMLKSMRGGSWSNIQDDMHTSSRKGAPKMMRSSGVGLRLARDLKPGEKERLTTDSSDKVPTLKTKM